MKLVARGRTIEFPRRPLIMGIVNLSADSFSGDGMDDIDAAVEKARALIAEGADIIDVGAESARTNRGPISEAEEIDRLCGFVAKWSVVSNQYSVISDQNESAPAATTDHCPLFTDHSPPPRHPLLSLNTWRPAVARAVLREGGDLLNDIGGLPTDENARICAETGAALLIMHSVGEPKVAHTHVGYRDVMDAMDEFFAEKIALAEAAGLPRDAIVLDPGIDFAKQRDDNLRIYRDLARLHRFERPILLPVSRKTVIGDVLGVGAGSEEQGAGSEEQGAGSKEQGAGSEQAAGATPCPLPPAPCFPGHARDAGTVACIVAGMLRGAQIFRVHNVRAASQAVRIIGAIG